MAVFTTPWDRSVSLQQAMDAFRESGWLQPGVSSRGAYPPLNVFQKDDAFTVIAEVAGIKKTDLKVQVKGNTIHLSGNKSVTYPDKASLHRCERLEGRFDRAVTLPFEIDPDGVKAQCRDGILALFLPRAERDKPKLIQVG